jgi:MraZ protein
MIFRGQHECTMDDKSRIKMPAALRKQFPPEDGNRFMIAADIEDCLVIYPMKTWEKTEQRLAGLNEFNIEHRRFIDAITTGLTEIEMDGNDRFLLSKSLLKLLGPGKEVVLKGKVDRIQVWEVSRLEQYTQRNRQEVEQLAGKAASYLDKNDKKES